MENITENTDLLRYDNKEIKALKKGLNQLLFERQESSILHNSVKWSERLFQAVLKGDIPAVQFALMQDLGGIPGHYTKNALRNEKTLAITLIDFLNVETITHNALSAELSLSIADVVITHVEAAADLEKVWQITTAGIYLYTEKIKEFRITHQYHPLVQAAQDYIFKNLHGKISIQQMAEQIGTSPGYLSSLFRKYENKTIQQFIREARLDRAKNMLKYSAYSLDEISQYLGFSSQSHMGKLFREAEGLTPQEYRNKFNDNYRKRF